MRFPAFSALTFTIFATTLAAHPIPDIPVRGSFDADGSCAIRVEVDPRCFEEDWEMETYLLHIQMTKLMSEADCKALKAKARAFVETGVEFFFDPQGPFKPEFAWEFTTLGGGPLVNIDDPVMVTGTWRTKMAEDAVPKGYSIRATPAIKFAVVFENTLSGKPVERTATLFPGERSFTLDLSGSNATAAAAPPEITEATLEDPKSGAVSWIWGSALLAAAVAALWLARRSRA
jgi:hypothetical protein